MTIQGWRLRKDGDAGVLGNEVDRLLGGEGVVSRFGSDPLQLRGVVDGLVDCRVYLPCKQDPLICRKVAEF